MNMHDLAKRLNGIEYGDGLSEEIKVLAKQWGLVIVTGASDDLIEFDGAISDEAGVYEGGTVALGLNGILRMPCDHDPDFIRCPYYENEIAKAKKIKALWCSPSSDATWSYETDIPHASFIMFEDHEIYCEGIVFNRLDLRVD